MSAPAAAPAAARTDVPPLDYTPVPDGFALPAGMNFGGVSGGAINANGHVFVLHPGPRPLMEFDADGRFIPGVGDGPFDPPHGPGIHAEGKIRTPDGGAHVVYKCSP